MCSEFSPVWNGAKMTKSQIKKYINDMKKAQKKAKERLKKAKESWEFTNEEIKVRRLEKLLEEDSLYE